MPLVQVPLTVPSGKVASNLTGFPVMVDLAQMPAEFWDHVAPDGGDVRVKAGVTDLPLDVVKIDVGTESGHAFFRADLLTAVDNDFTVECGSGAPAPAPTDPTGRNAVWAGFHRMFDCAEHWVDRTGNGQGLLAVRTPGYLLTGGSSVASIPNGSGLNYVQGVTGDGTHYYVTQSNYLYKYDASWNLVASDSDPLATSGLDALGCNHLADLCHHDGKLYIPIENFTRAGFGSSSQQHIAVFDAATLAHIQNYDISAQDVSNAGICYYPEANEFWIVTYYGGGTIYRYSTSFAFLGAVTLSRPMDELQGIEWWNGRFYVTDDQFNNILELLPDGTLTRIVASSIAGGAGTSAQGLYAANSGTLLTGEGVFVNAIRSWGYYTESLPSGGVADWLNFNNTGSNDYAFVDGLTKYSTWTYGVSVSLFAKVSGNNQGYGSYTQYLSSDNTRRASLAYRGTGSTDRWGIWNSTDTWLNAGSAPSAGTGTVYRLHMQHDGTTARHLAIDGSVATDAGAAIRPAGNGDTIYVGRGDQGFGEGCTGRVNWIYLHPSALSATWIAAEASNWNDPGGFSDVGSALIIPDDVEVDFDATLEDCALASAAIVPVVGLLESDAEDCSLDSAVFIPPIAVFADVVEDCVLTSAAAQVGDGVLALVDAAAEDCALDAAVTVDIVGALDAVLEDCVLSSVAVSGSLGPFPRRPFLILN